MHFDTKSYLKSNCYHTAKHTKTESLRTLKFISIGSIVVLKPDPVINPV